jgi:hypothetical protein
VLGKAMTTRGRQTAFAFGVLVALALPIRVPCRVPGRTACEVVSREHGSCEEVDLEPIGVYAIEWLTHDDLPIAYRRRTECRY